MSEEEKVRAAVGGVLCNSLNYPREAAAHVLGRDMTPLIDATVDVILTKFLPEHDARVLEEAANAYEALPEGSRTYFPKIHGRWLRERASERRKGAGQ